MRQSTKQKNNFIYIETVRLVEFVKRWSGVSEEFVSLTQV